MNRIISLAVVLTALTGAVSAQFTPISGALSGTLAPGVYHATGNISVAATQTLTLSPGVIIKFVGNRQLIINGTLLSNGTAANPVIFTDDADDSAGGDTNGNGPSVGSPGSWYNLVFQSGSDASTLTYTEVRYAGTSNYVAVDLNAADITLSNCTIRNSQARALDASGSSYPTVSNCSILDNGGRATDGVLISNVPDWTNNTASGNTTNYLRITNANVTASLTLGTQSIIDGALVLASNMTVQPAAILTLQAGVVVKMEGNYQVVVNGTLDCQGTAANPVIFTDDADDSAGGDTNNNGASVGSPGSWYNIVFQNGSDASTLAYTEVRFAGVSSYVAIDLNAADITLNHCTIRNCQARGIDASGNSYPTVSNCSILDNGGRATDGVLILNVSDWTNNMASGNLTNYLRITNANVTASLTLGTQSILDGAIVLAGTMTVQAAATLTLQAGVIVKMEGNRQVLVNGTLDCQGTAANPVIFTDDADDSAGGDTNNNGLSVGSPGSWYNVIFQSGSDASTMAYTEVRFAGTSSYPAVDLNAADIDLSHCTIRNCQARGLDLSGNSYPTVANCSILDNGSNSVDGVAIAAVPGFVNNVATGNGIDCMRITSGTVTGSLVLGTESMLAGAHLLANTLTVTATGVLTVQQGVVFKVQGNRQVVVNGALNCRGTAYEPVVFTDDADDSIAGDSNGDGPSSGSPGSWYNIVVQPGAGPSLLRNVLLRFGGTSSYNVVDANNSGLVLESVRVDEAQSTGFRLRNLGVNPTNLVAWECGGNGIHLVDGAFDILHATSTTNTTGIRREAAWNGTIINSNCWGNTTNYVNLTAGEVLNCNGGFSGGNGNLDADPLFVDEPNGDLHLLPGSPCLGSADYTFGLMTVKDHDENSRVLDSGLIGIALPDMGAYERGNWHMNVTNTPRPGETVYLTVQGPAGDSFLGFGLLDGTALFQPYGLLLAGSATGVALVFPFPIAVGTPIPLTVPNSPGLAGTIIGMQTLNFATGNLLAGNFAELYRVLVRP